MQSSHRKRKHHTATAGGGGPGPLIHTENIPKPTPHINPHGIFESGSTLTEKGIDKALNYFGYPQGVQSGINDSIADPAYDISQEFRSAREPHPNENRLYYDDPDEPIDNSAQFATVHEEDELAEGALDANEFEAQAEEDRLATADLEGGLFDPSVLPGVGGDALAGGAEGLAEGALAIAGSAIPVVGELIDIAALGYLIYETAEHTSSFFVRHGNKKIIHFMAPPAQGGEGAGDNNVSVVDVDRGILNPFYVCIKTNKRYTFLFSKSIQLKNFDVWGNFATVTTTPASAPKSYYCYRRQMYEMPDLETSFYLKDADFEWISRQKCWKMEKAGWKVTSMQMYHIGEANPTADTAYRYLMQPPNPNIYIWDENCNHKMPKHYLRFGVVTGGATSSVTNEVGTDVENRPSPMRQLIETAQGRDRHLSTMGFITSRQPSQTLGSTGRDAGVYENFKRITCNEINVQKHFQRNIHLFKKWMYTGAPLVDILPYQSSTAIRTAQANMVTADLEPQVINPTSQAQQLGAGNGQRNQWSCDSGTDTEAARFVNLQNYAWWPRHNSNRFMDMRDIEEPMGNHTVGHNLKTNYPFIWYVDEIPNHTIVDLVQTVYYKITVETNAEYCTNTQPLLVNKPGEQNASWANNYEMLKCYQNRNIVNTIPAYIRTELPGTTTDVDIPGYHITPP